jgi:hypothetical protein
MRNPQRKGSGINVDEVELRRVGLSPYGTNSPVGAQLTKVTKDFEIDSDFTADTFRPDLKWILFEHNINTTDITFTIYNTDTLKPVFYDDFLLAVGSLQLWFRSGLKDNLTVVVIG